MPYGLFHTLYFHNPDILKILEGEYVICDF